MEHLGRHATHTPVIQRDAVHAYERGHELEMQVWDERQRLPPIRTYCNLALEPTGWLTHDLGNHGRRHFEFLCIVGEDAGEIVAVPSSNPVLCEMLGEIVGYHKDSTLEITLS